MRLYHGTSSSRAKKILEKGFRPERADDAVFFAEDKATAELFAVTTKPVKGKMPPHSFTLMIFDIPDELANELFERGAIGEFRGVRRICLPNSSGYEQILNGREAIDKFNAALKGNIIQLLRHKIE